MIKHFKIRFQLQSKNWVYLQKIELLGSFKIAEEELFGVRLACRQIQ